VHAHAHTHSTHTHTHMTNKLALRTNIHKISQSSTEIEERGWQIWPK